MNYADLSADEALQAIARIFDEGTDADGWDISILEEVYLVLTERGLATDDDDDQDGMDDDGTASYSGMAQSAMLQHHLEHNLFPPLDSTWAPVAQAAIEAAEARMLDSTLQTPAGFTAAQNVMDSLHLWDFVKTYEEDA